MSKAFTKETDDDGEDDPLQEDTFPKHLKNYMTPAGAKAMQDELRHLTTTERPKVVEVVSWAAGNGDRSENGDYIYGKKRLREIDRRIRFLSKRLETTEVVDPARQQGLEQVFFGATVTYAAITDEEFTVKLVGVDETNAEEGRISWISPLAKALMKARVGDMVEFHAPGGKQKIEILVIEYLA